jgi:hypothetical protein
LALLPFGGEATYDSPISFIYFLRAFCILLLF